MKNTIFHLAIPCKDVAEAKTYYVDQLGFGQGRMYDDRISINFFGDQVVCHLCPEKVDPIVEMYPRHYGQTFTCEMAFDEFYQRVLESGVALYKALFVRFEGKKEAHKTFFLVDPSNNLLEFKYYFDQSQNF
ncbi:VOC family protein [Rheinheimera maricola]|uniref:VOC domain-containing protein n=1 Tax=Rheinheimera maricola TaxID=2793282 RepID=A0ABS7X3T9_9GAMM|nr:VOC family protein [Rheinheimera maricola]MBZ9610216.1 hypothetical protein [Rheinheimera maricola]